MIKIMKTSSACHAFFWIWPPHEAPTTWVLTLSAETFSSSATVDLTLVTSVEERLSVVTRQSPPAFCTMIWWTPPSATAPRTCSIEALGALKVKTEPPLNSTPKLRPWTSRPAIGAPAAARRSSTRASAGRRCRR